jgi:hypothetical protein
MSEITLNFERWLDDAVVEAVIEFDYEDDFDFVPYGEGSVRREYRTINILSIEYSCNGQKYSPTKEEEKFWEEDLEDTINDAICKGAA